MRNNKIKLSFKILSIIGSSLLLMCLSGNLTFAHNWIAPKKEADHFCPKSVISGKKIAYKYLKILAG